MENNMKRKPKLLEALSPILFMLFLLGCGYAFFDLPPEPLMILSCVFAGILVKKLGYSYNDILDSISFKISKTMPALLILITVGLLIGTWIIGGTIPMMIYYGLKVIDPKFIYITALFLTAIVSICTGTSWGSAGTVGVAFMGVAIGLDANLAATAGAIVAGAYFGDKLSPLSDTTNIASAATNVDLYEHIAHLLYTTLPSFLISALVYIVYGFNINIDNVATPDKVLLMISGLESIYNFNLFLLIPVIIILWGSITKKPTIPVMLFSAVIASFNAIFIQHFSLNDVINSALNGFNISMLPDSLNISSDLARLLNRGGMNSMMGTLLICFCALSFAGILSLSGALDVIINYLLRLVRSTASLIFITILCGLTMIGVTCNGQISILIPGEMLKDAYIDRGLHPKNLSRTVEDSATIIEPILPWTAAGAYMAGTLGVATLTYLPWAILCWSGIVFAMIYGISGIGIAKLKQE
ncbi:Na+/H+ antiporter NhaC [Histophilus somni]|uniref:Na+/H+ antiporter NhaC n=2 Tax=Histophilus somni TaxID=731 RepID=A0A9Q7E410_HISSO|nr:Na+/H+ antiporter NhaC [Histophilus somni]ACA30990.1 Na+/H+ antiporter NhaC [Histophilus somni 2336]ARU64989.1 Na+/H+ antiporter NhaC [Histophilus somni]ARU66855.1 Na+/H+ antiporter NhaC [Histophilus somni]ARU68726.1 Na+/H+ antiporter NhaC [Histophilus somni]ARU70608.1 Na+/H+ antiporter NhaC [Histophilus somni]